jgi:hypothetical protein
MGQGLGFSKCSETGPTKKNPSPWDQTASYTLWGSTHSLVDSIVPKKKNRVYKKNRQYKKKYKAKKSTRT